MTEGLRVLILADGDPPSAALLHRLVAGHDLLIATDGAARKAQTLGRTPDIISGDFDSISLEDVRRDYRGTEIIPTPDQDQGDLEKAIHIAQGRGAATITITGATGGRLDHTLGTIALLLRYHREVDIRLVEDASVTWAVSGTEDAPGEFTLTTTTGDTISVVSFDGRAHVTLQGVRWPLTDHPMPVGTLGISNRAMAEQVTIAARGGTLVVCHSTP